MKNVTVYPLRSAMHGAVNVWTRRWGYVCFKPPTYVFGRWWSWYFYVSPNATPWAATFILGGDSGRHEKRLATVRRVLWGHGYSTDTHDPQSADAYLASLAGDLPSSPPTPESLRATAEWYDENEPEVTYEGVSAGMVLRSIAYRLEHRRPPHGGDDE